MKNLLGSIPESDDPPYSHEASASGSVHWRARARADLLELNMNKNKPPIYRFSPRRVFTHPTFWGKDRSPWERVQAFGSRGNESEPKENGPKRAATCDTFNSLEFDETSVWDQKSILSLDGGGIRGYSSLLILRALMKAIGEIERQWPSDPAESSFHPLEPPSVDSDALHRYPRINTKHTERNETSPWLPCHYFDYMAGTSTGGLISIMLGRLRMSIDDCIDEYETLGPKVFAHPRWFHLKSPLFWPRDKYDHRSLEKAIREVIDRRSSFVYGGDKSFASDENRIVLSYRKQDKGVESPYIFRSYDNLHRNDELNKGMLHRNPGVANKNEIWKVARATSAAPAYFKPMKIDDDEYLDGGFGANNPCAEVYDEVQRMNNSAERCVGLIISVGTGKLQQSRFQGRGFRRYIGFFHFATKWAADSEEKHIDMTRLNLPNYARFNVESALGAMKLDEWRDRGSLRLKTGETISKLKSRRGEDDALAHAHAQTTNKEKKAPPLDNDPSSSSSTPSSSSSSPNPLSPPQTPTPEEKKNIPKFFQPKNKTLEKITNLTGEYLSQPDVQNLIISYAQRLVETRRARVHQDKDRWEKSCYRIWYHCKIHRCPRGEEKYPTREKLRKHILHKHYGGGGSGAGGGGGSSCSPEEEEIERILDRGKFLIP